MSLPAPTVPLNRHVLAMKRDCVRAEMLARELCAAAGCVPALAPVYVQQAWGLLNKWGSR